MKRSITVFLTGIFAVLTGFTLFAETVSKRIFQQDSEFKFNESVLEMTVQTRKGSPYSEQVVNDDVKRLAARGVFADVSASIRKMPDGTVEVTFRMLAKPLVAAVRFEGNQKITDDKLRPMLRFTLHAPLNDNDVMATADVIRKMYEEAGRGQTKVKPVIETRADGTVAVTFKIEEELRIRVNSVSFKGNKVYKTSELTDVLETRYSPMSVNWLSWIPVEGRMPGLYYEDAVEMDKVRLRELYLRKGYLDFKVKSVSTAELKDDPEKVDVLFEVEEGEPYFVGEIRVNGQTVYDEKKIRSCIKLTSENVYNVKTEDEDCRRIENLYAPEGYADFKIKVQKYPNFKTHTVDLEYRIHEGPQYTIGDITINGNKKTKAHVILRELPFKPDDKMDTRKLEIAKQRLMGMNYFEPMQGDEGINSGVEVTSVNSPLPGKKDINISVNEKRFLHGRIGGAWSDSDGLAGFLEVSHSNVDILDPANYFVGGGQRARLYAMVGTERKDAVFEFVEPWLFGIPLRWETQVYWRETEFEDWEERRIGFTTSLTKRFFDDFTSAKLGYTLEHVKIDDMDRKMSYIFQSQEGSERNGKLFLQLERDTRDSYTDPRNGYKIGAYGAMTWEGFGATSNYFKAELYGINHFSFFHNWFVLTTGFKIGMMDTFGGDKFVPLYDRYFLGGGDSLRGFPYRSVGPEDYREDNYGGEFMYLFTAELSHPIYKDYLRGAVFCDVGNATKRNFKFLTPNVGVGYGLRIKLPNFPMPIRLDLAYPVVNRQKDVKDRLRFHFSLGFSLF